MGRLRCECGFHPWGQWKDAGNGVVVRSEKDKPAIGAYVHQLRRCSICNKLQLRTSVSRVEGSIFTVEIVAKEEEA